MRKHRADKLHYSYLQSDILESEIELIVFRIAFIAGLLIGPVSQIHSPHLHVGTPVIFSDLLRSVQMLERERVGCGKQREVTGPIYP